MTCATIVVLLTTLAGAIAFSPRHPRLQRAWSDGALGASAGAVLGTLMGVEAALAVALLGGAVAAMAGALALPVAANGEEPA